MYILYVNVTNTYKVRNVDVEEKFVHMKALLTISRISLVFDKTVLHGCFHMHNLAFFHNTTEPLQVLYFSL